MTGNPLGGAPKKFRKAAETKRSPGQTGAVAVSFLDALAYKNSLQIISFFLSRAFLSP